MDQTDARNARLEETRLSLVGRLADWRDDKRWQDFFDAYWKLIYSVARRAGLSDAEAQDVVQETVLSVARNVSSYDPAAGSFKAWLLQMTRWRIVDQLRKRLPAPETSTGESAHDRADINAMAAPAEDDAVQDAWEAEWRGQVLAAAMERLKRQVKAQHFQIFECCLVRGWSPARTAAELRVNIAQVYLIKHRLTGLLKKHVEAVTEGALAGRP